jgi:hypothetical protein
VWPSGQVYTRLVKGARIVIFYIIFLLLNELFPSLSILRSGCGTHQWPDGWTVTGLTLNGHLHGHIFFTWPDGATYNGNIVKGQKEGCVFRLTKLNYIMGMIIS